MVEGKRIPIPEKHRAKMLLWASRHCCFCGRQCTTNIVIHHIDGDPSNNDMDNLIAVCFDCHGELERYNIEHPVGTKYRHFEIKSRRDQVYERYTLPYLRQVNIRISNYMVDGRLREVGDISCTVHTLSTDIPVKLRLRIVPYHADKRMEIELGDLYGGAALWNLNPAQIITGHFDIPISGGMNPFDFRIEVFWSIVDILDREHQMLPCSYVWNDPDGDWWFDPRVVHEEN